MIDRSGWVYACRNGHTTTPFGAPPVELRIGFASEETESEFFWTAEENLYQNQHKELARSQRGQIQNSSPEAATRCGCQANVKLS